MSISRIRRQFDKNEHWVQKLHARLGADYSFESFLKDIQQWMMAFDRNASVSADVGCQNARADDRAGDRSPGAVGDKDAKRITIITAREFPIAQKGVRPSKSGYQPIDRKGVATLQKRILPVPYSWVHESVPRPKKAYDLRALFRYQI